VAAARRTRQVIERREFPRYPALGLTAQINGQVFVIQDISMGGLRLCGSGTVPEGGIDFIICPAGGEPSVDGIKATAVVVARYGDKVALKFDKPSMPLLKLVVRQASASLGVEPFLVK
jgi:hypothetical protein